MSYKNRLQSNSRLNQQGDYLPGQSFNFSNLKYYTQDRVWDYIKSFDCTIRSIRQNLLNNYKALLNHYKAILNYLITLPESVHPITINLIKDNIVLLELTFEYTI